jgi:hypothetical protein
LWGDVLFDPLGCALCALGIAVCLRDARRDRTCAILLAALAAALVPGFISSYDQPSLLRVFALPVPASLLAALGFTALTARVPGERSRLAIAAAAATLVGGTFLFDVVNPRILQSSAVGLTVRSLSSDDLGRTTVLTAKDENPPYLFLDTIAAQVPPRPITVLDLARTEALFARSEPPGPEEELLVWTPAVEEAARMTYRVCQRWRSAAVYTLADRSGLTHVLVARPQGHGWIPRLARDQWTVAACGTDNAAGSPVVADARPPSARDVLAPEGSAPGAPPRNLRGTDLTGADLRGADLQRKQLAGALMRNAKLEGANLAGADLRGAILDGADLSAANLGGAELTNADLTGASLRKAKVVGADLNGAILKNADLTDADLSGSRLAGADLTGAHLAGTNFSGAQLVETKLPGSDLSHASMGGANMRGAVLAGADLSGLDLSKGIFSARISRMPACARQTSAA